MWNKDYMGKIYKLIGLFFILICIYTISLTFVYSIPNSKIANNLEKSYKVLDVEGVYPKPFFYTDSIQLDNATDRLMLQETVKQEGLTALQSAVSVNGYYRYWHGYQVFLRPMLYKLNYLNIRYINLFIFFITLAVMIILLKERLGYLISISFLISILLAYAFIVPMSLQFIGVFMIMMVAAIFILSKYNKGKLNESLIYFFFIIGSFTNFIDFLTAPLLTLGIPLIIIILLSIKEEVNEKALIRISNTLKYSSFWALGYALTWAGKWVLATIVLKVNSFMDASNAILFRTQGNNQYPLNHLRMFYINIKSMFTPISIRLGIFVVLLWLIAFVFYRKRLAELIHLIPLLIVALFPYAWFFVLGNHSEIHFWFTYRIQSITVFGILAFMIFSIDFKKIVRGR